MTGGFQPNRLSLDMKMLDKATSHPRARTWKNIGNTGVPLLDAIFFFFLPIVSAILTVAGIVAITLIYVFYPVVVH